jgi:opacity protein-like surface antigen
MRPCAVLLALAAIAAPRGARAYERQWHLGADFGYALAGFPDVTVSGFGGGAHVVYGITDAFNLRLHADFTAFELPDPQTAAFVYSAAFGAEYVLDVLEWVPYVGALVGPVYVVRLDADDPAVPDDDHVHLGIELPLGLGYQLSRTITIGGEVRYRLFFLGDEETSPTNGLLVLGRFELTWGY